MKTADTSRYQRVCTCEGLWCVIPISPPPYYFNYNNLLYYAF
jgi:hypothetical protein